MTSPLSPEAVAQMVADREAAYQSYLNEITTNGNSRLDNIILSLSGNEVQQRHIATQIDMAFQAGWHHMLTSLAAENATLRAENEELDFLRHEGGPDSVAAMEIELATLRASEAAAMEALAEIGAVVTAIEGADSLDKEIIRNIGTRIAAITPTADKEPKI